MERVYRYKSFDGEIFDTPEEVRKHEKELVFEQFVAGTLKIPYRDELEDQDVIKWLISYKEEIIEFLEVVE